MPKPEVTHDEQEFLSRMIRQARTSLAAINGYANLLSEAASESERQQYIHAICTDAGHLASVVNMIVNRFGMKIPPDDADESPSE